MGLRNAFLNFRQYEETHIMENVIYFVANQGNKRYYIQSAFALHDQEKMDQEQASLIKISDSFKKMIVVNSNTPVWRNDQGILVMNLYDFLLNEDSLDM